MASPASPTSPDISTMVIWLLYQEDEISTFVTRLMRVALLVDKAVTIVSSRGQGVCLDQVELRCEGVVLLPSRTLSDYGIDSEDIIEIFVVTEAQTIANESSSQAKNNSAAPPP